MKYFDLFSTDWTWESITNARRYRKLRWWQVLKSDDMAEYHYHDKAHCRGCCYRHVWQ